MTHSATGWMLPAQMGINTVCHLNLDTPTNLTLCGGKVTVWVVVRKSLVQKLNQMTTDISLQRKKKLHEYVVYVIALLKYWTDQQDGVCLFAYFRRNCVISSLCLDISHRKLLTDV